MLTSYGNVHGPVAARKSKIIVSCIILAALSVSAVLWFLRPAPVFGHTDKLYDTTPQPLDLIEGGDLFDISYCGIYGDGAWFRLVPKTEGANYTFTDAEWTADRATGVRMSSGTVSQRVRGKWEEPKDIGVLLSGDPNAQDFYLRTSDGGCTFCVRLPLYEYSGKVRVTLYFRECVLSKVTGCITSVGDVLSALFEMDMPKPGRSMFDVTSADFVFSDRFELNFRNNTEEDITLWLDKDSFLLEKDEGDGGYSEVMRGYRDPYYTSSTGEKRYERLAGSLDRTYCCQFSFSEAPEPGDYRLTLNFYTGEDGTGDCYTLTLRLRLHA